MRKIQSGLAQSATEFVLVAPLLFFIFFAVIQAAYTAYVSFAVQRAALAVARTASLEGPLSPVEFQKQLVLSLLPITRLSSQTWTTIFNAQISLSYSGDLTEVTAQIRYPLPILIPLVGKVFGTPAPAQTDRTAMSLTIQSVLALLNQKQPDPSSFPSVSYVIWVTHQESTFNEGYGKLKRLLL